LTTIDSTPAAGAAATPVDEAGADGALADGALVDETVECADPVDAELLVGGLPSTAEVQPLNATDSTAVAAAAKLRWLIRMRRG
jgi:hypothetical protein